MIAHQHVFPQTRTYHFMDGSQRRFEGVQDVVMSAWEHIWLPGETVVNINPANVKYTVCTPEARLAPWIDDAGMEFAGSSEALRRHAALVASEYELLKKLGLTPKENSE